MNRFIKYFCSVIVVCSSGCSVCSSGFQQASIVNEVSVQQLSTQSYDHKEIAYDLYQGDHGGLIVLAPGFYNSKQTVLFKEMAIALNADYDVLIMDFRGHGKSRGLFTWTATEFRDLQTLLRLYRPQYDQIGLIGFSLGAATSVIAESRENYVDSLILVSAPSDFRKIDFQFWRMGFFENLSYNFFGDGRKGKGVRPGWPWCEKIRPIDVIDQINIPKLFVHGADDWLIRPWHTEKLYAKAVGQKQLLLIPGGSHAEYLYRNEKDETIHIYKNWFAQTLR